MTARRLSHLNEAGEARMVDVSDKAVTERSATAEGFVAMAQDTLDLILRGGAPKGDVLSTARIAGIMAAKRTHELIPLCHPLPLTQVTVERSGRHSCRGDRKGRGQDRRRDGGADRGRGRLPHHLRHGEGGRSGRRILRHQAGREDRRPLRHLSPLILHGLALRS